MRRARKKNRRGQRTVLHVAVTQKAHSKKMYNRAILMGGALLLLAIVGLGVHVASKSLIKHALYQNEDFVLKNIEVDVQGSVSRADILAWAGVREGQNLMTLNLDVIRRRLGAMPYVASVRVERDLPDTLRLVVEERQPVAKIVPNAPPGSQLVQPVYYIDAQGYMMKPKPGERLKPLPTIAGVSHEFIQEGVRTERYEILSALNLLRLADYSALKGELDLTQIQVQSKGYLILRTRGNGVIRFRTGMLDLQVQRLQVIFDYARSRSLFVRTVDLTPERNVPVTFF